MPRPDVAASWVWGSRCTRRDATKIRSVVILSFDTPNDSPHRRGIAEGRRVACRRKRMWWICFQLVACLTNDHAGAWGIVYDGVRGFVSGFRGLLHVTQVDNYLHRAIGVPTNRRNKAVRKKSIDGIQFGDFTCHSVPDVGRRLAIGIMPCPIWFRSVMCHGLGSSGWVKRSESEFGQKKELFKGARRGKCRGTTQSSVSRVATYNLSHNLE